MTSVRAFGCVAPAQLDLGRQGGPPLDVGGGVRDRMNERPDEPHGQRAPLSVGADRRAQRPVAAERPGIVQRRHAVGLGQFRDEHDRVHVTLLSVQV